ncbi:uncharacterized protein LOC129612101 [Condylostylus longicornis]|uniref:uncharacterized protein LOC129612101 n=1 Tax=Condylostylus longicornis TaxID=2530218 RepID=UPI00244DED13|nr:uncharacterized protein LOC129612101 [Condylostylus longicornis]
MYWILKRTGAANFFNSLNNSNNTSKITGNNKDYGYKNKDKSIKRTERKYYDRLSIDSDDIIFSQTNIKTSEHENGFHDSNIKKSKTFQDTNNMFEDDKELTLDFSWNKKLNLSTNNKQKEKQNQQDIQTKLLDNKQDELQFILDKNANYINQIEPITTMLEDEDFDEALICNVCDSEFDSPNRLAQHQQKKRHFGCNECDSLFTSLMLLELHKDNFEHWSTYDTNRTPCCRRNRIDDFGDTDSFISETASEDLERLL